MTPNQHKQPNRCKCEYGKNGKLLGLCLRCFERELKSANKARQLLLNEVRERVIGEDEKVVLLEWVDKKYVVAQENRNDLRAEQRQALTEMEK